MGEFSGVRNELGAVMQFAVALCHSVVLQAFCNFRVFYAIGNDIRGLGSLHCVCHTKLLIHFVFRTAWLR